MLKGPLLLHFFFISVAAASKRPVFLTDGIFSLVNHMSVCPLS